MILFAIRSKTSVPVYVVTMAKSREHAKQVAAKQPMMQGAPDDWDVVPITEPDAKVVIDLALQT